MTYAEMSDFSIAEAIVKTLSLEDCEQWCAGTNPDSDNGWGIIISNDDDGSWRYFDPCNNPADMWPLIVRQKISLSMDGCLPCAYKDEIYDSSGLVVGSDYFFEHANPLRAAAIVYLMMMEAGK